jgi:hypothetical protein
MKRIRSKFVILLLCILILLLINLSTSMSYRLVGDWEAVSNVAESYEKSGWTTYTMEGSNMAEIVITEGGSFNFAWKMDKPGSQNKLYFRNGKPMLGKTTFTETDYNNVNNNDTLKWVFSVSDRAGGQVWIAFPPQGDATGRPCPIETSGTNEIETSGTNEIEALPIETPVTILNCGNELQKYIDSSENNSDVILDELCNINKTIVIKNKRNLSITSKNGLAKLDGQGINKLLSIVDSEYINISKLNMCNSTYGIEIINSNHIKIINNEIVFAFPGDGILILGGGDNTIYGNSISNVSDSFLSPDTSVGINLTSTWRNQIERNAIFSANPNGIICSYVINNSVNKFNKIKFFKKSEPFLVIQDQYLGRWNESISDFDCTDHYGNCIVDCSCMIHDLQDDPMVWEP